jgi:putative thioredoxin
MALIGFNQPKKSNADATAGPNGDVIKEGTDASFRADVIDASLETPVLVDFWAPWCGPCRTLTPIIEKVVIAAKGKVKLVKINIDENPGFAGQLRVQSIPAVFAFQDGKPVDGFMGAQPESQIKAFIDRLIGDTPDGIEELLASGAESLSIGDIGGAAQSYAQAASLDPKNATAIAGLARCYLLGGNVEQARELIATIPKEKAKDPSVVAVLAQLALTEAASDAGDGDMLAAEVRASPDDLQAWFDLAKARIGEGDLDGASHALLEIITRERNWKDDAARKQLLTLFEAAGPASETARNGRRRLSAILFS